MGLFGKKKNDTPKKVNIICDCCGKEFEPDGWRNTTSDSFLDRKGFDIWNDLTDVTIEYHSFDHNGIIDFGTKKVCKKCFAEIYEGITGQSCFYASGDDHDMELAKLKYKHIADMIDEMSIDEVQVKRQIALDKIAEEEAEKEALKDAEARRKASETAAKMDEWLKNLE